MRRLLTAVALLALALPGAAGEVASAKLDILGGATARTIALLKERRAALIAGAVTGLIDVQEAGRKGFGVA